MPLIIIIIIIIIVQAKFKMCGQRMSKTISFFFSSKIEIEVHET